MSLHVIPERLPVHLVICLYTMHMTHAIQHAIPHAIFSEANEITMVTNNAISASEIKRIKHVVCGIKRIDHILSGSCRDGLTGDTSLATLLLVLSGYEWWCKQYKVGTGLTLFQEYIKG